MKLNIQKLFDDILGLADKVIPDGTKRLELKAKIYELRGGLRSGKFIDILSGMIFANYSIMRILGKNDEIDLYMLLVMLAYQFGLENFPKLNSFLNKKKEK